MNRDIAQVTEELAGHGYVAEPEVATAVFLARKLRKPLLIEGDAGVGKTEVAKVLASMLDTELIRLQCYEGLDVNTALYEWNYQRQLLRLKIAERDTADASLLEQVIFGREYLVARPLLQAITRDAGPPVLLVDEIDRADDGFEAFLLEILSDFQVTIPELGTIEAVHVPYVVLTSNATREIGDALRRRCLYLFIGHPTIAKETRIIREKVPELPARLAEQVARFVHAVRSRELRKTPGVAETLDWARALVGLHCDDLDPEVVVATLGCFLKDRFDIGAMARETVAELVAGARSNAA